MQAFVDSSDSADWLLYGGCHPVGCSSHWNTAVIVTARVCWGRGMRACCLSTPSACACAQILVHRYTDLLSLFFLLHISAAWEDGHSPIPVATGGWGCSWCPHTEHPHSMGSSWPDHTGRLHSELLSLPLLELCILKLSSMARGRRLRPRKALCSQRHDSSRLNAYLKYTEER